MLGLENLLDELRPLEGLPLDCIQEVDSTAFKSIELRHVVGQLNHLTTRTVWAQQSVH